MKKFLLLLAISVLFFAGSFYFWNLRQNSVSNNPPTGVAKMETKQEPSKPIPQKTEIPSSYDLKVPFVAQAPFGVWDELHDNACEEASVILVHYYKKKLSLSKEKADKEIKKMVDFQIKKYGRHKDLTAQETAELAKEFYGYKNVKVVYDFSWDELKKEVAQGNPVIVPAAGRLLKNLNFRQPGPIYHMFVIRGYTPSEIITNDVGTRKGESYRYSYQILNNALHDWTAAETITRGRKAMIVIEN